jgi:hypothetical protein
MDVWGWTEDKFYLVTALRRLDLDTGNFTLSYTLNPAEPFHLERTRILPPPKIIEGIIENVSPSASWQILACLVLHDLILRERCDKFKVCQHIIDTPSLFMVRIKWKLP